MLLKKRERKRNKPRQIQSTDISFPRSRKGSLKPLKTLWKSTMGVQPASTLPTDCLPSLAKGGPLNEYQLTIHEHFIVDDA
jgi:hypothetical protein